MQKPDINTTDVNIDGNTYNTSSEVKFLNTFAWMLLMLFLSRFLQRNQSVLLNSLQRSFSRHTRMIWFYAKCSLKGFSLRGICDVGENFSDLTVRLPDTWLNFDAKMRRMFNTSLLGTSYRFNWLHRRMKQLQSSFPTGGFPSRYNSFFWRVFLTLKIKPVWLASSYIIHCNHFKLTVSVSGWI